MEKDQTLDELEQEVIDDLNLEFTPDENPNKMFSVVFPYQVQNPERNDPHIQNSSKMRSSISSMSSLGGTYRDLVAQ